MPSSILIIDDQKALCHFLEQAMLDDGHEVRTAGNGAEARAHSTSDGGILARLSSITAPA